jgi:hypothetical protein
MIFRARLVSSTIHVLAVGYSITIAVCCTSNAQAHWPSIELQRLSRLGGTIGTSFETSVVDGVHSDEIDELVFSTPAATASPIYDSLKPHQNESAKIGTGRFQVTIPASATEGFIDARVKGRFGLSNSRRFWITKEPWQVETWKLTSPSEPRELKPNIIFQDRFEPRYRNYYRLNVETPKVIHLAILSRVLDSQSEIDLSLLGPDGRKVASFDAGHSSPVSSWKIDQAGAYTLVLNDRLFRGGNGFSYALLWKDVIESENDDLVDRWKFLASRRFLHPIIQHGSSDSETEESKSFQIPYSHTALSPKILTLRPPTSNARRIEHLEVDYPKNKSCSVPIPGLIKGTFDFNLDEDWFEVEPAENESIVAEIVSERIGERTDPIIAVYRVTQDANSNERLEMVVKGDDLEASNDPMSFSSRDSSVMIKASQSGKYRILVRDQQRISSSSYRSRYVLELRQPKPGFQIMAYWAYPGRDRVKSNAISPTLIQSGSLALAVRAYRHDGWTGLIDVRIQNAPEFLGNKEITLVPQQSIGHCILVGTEESFDWIPKLQVIGSAAIGEDRSEQIAQSAEYIWGPSETFRAPIVRLTDSIPFAFESRDKLPIVIKLGGPTPTKSPPGATLKIPVKVDRSENAKQPVTIRLVDLPPSTKAKDLKIEADQDSGEVELTIPEATPIGQYSIWAQGETKVMMPVNPQSLERAKETLANLERIQNETADSNNDEFKSSIKEATDLVTKLQESTKPKSFDLQLPSNQLLIQVVEKE